MEIDVSRCNVMQWLRVGFRMKDSKLSGFEVLFSRCFLVKETHTVFLYPVVVINGCQRGIKWTSFQAKGNSMLQVASCCRNSSKKGLPNGPCGLYLYVVWSHHRHCGTTASQQNKNHGSIKINSYVSEMYQRSTLRNKYQKS